MPPELLSSEMRVIFQLMKISHFYEADDDESVSQRRLLLIVRLSLYQRRRHKNFLCPAAIKAKCPGAFSPLAELRKELVCR